MRPVCVCEQVPSATTSRLRNLGVKRCAVRKLPNGRHVALSSGGTQPSRRAVQSGAEIQTVTIDSVACAVDLF
jgi:hypothetical protein